MKKKLKVAIQMDPLEQLNLGGDSTFALALEGIQRNYELLYYSPDDMFYKNGDVFAHVKNLDVFIKNDTEGYKYGKEKLIDLSDCDVILIRQDPPFNLNYITSTHLLEKISRKTLIINDPFEIRNAPEKIFVTNFLEFMPNTIISRDINVIKSFKEKNNSMIIKPLYGNGGEGVFHIKKDDENLNSILEICFKVYDEPLIIQEYIPEVREGDKRIILIDGEIVGAINRIPAEGESRSNMHVGGKPEKTFITKRDQVICEKISPFLKSKGLFFVGIDIIGKYITEINVTSPTGIREINNLYNRNIQNIFWNKVETKLINHSA